MNGNTNDEKNGHASGEYGYEGPTAYMQQNSTAELLTLEVVTKPGGKKIGKRQKRKTPITVISFIAVLVVVALAVAGVVTAVVLLAGDHQGSERASNSSSGASAPTGLPTTEGVTGVCRTSGCVTLANILLENIDETVDPCEDFYNFSCGGWLSRTPLPQGKEVYTQPQPYASANKRKLRHILESDAAGGSEDIEAVARVNGFYRLCMDMQAINETGAEPLLALIEKTGGWNIIGGRSEEWSINSTQFIQEKLYRSRALVNFGVDVDEKNSSQYIIKISQGNSLLPDYVYSSDYYISRINSFKSYFVKVMSLLNSTVPANTYQETAEEIIAFERELVKIFSFPSGVDAKYNKMTLGELSNLWPDFDWVGSLQYLFSLLNVSVDENETVIVETPTYFRNLSAIFRNTSSETLENYSKWHLVSFYVRFLSRPFIDAYYDFQQRGEPKQASTCLKLVQSALPIAIARQYIEQIYPEGSKEKSQDMVNRITETFRKRLEEREWLDDATRKLVLEKVDNIVAKVAYPDELFNDTYLNSLSSDIIIYKNNFMRTVAEARRALLSRDLGRLHRPVNRDAWTESPTTVNAFYDFNTNELILPAAYTLPPNMGSDWPDYYNFGALGTVIGHELTHGFDNQGQQFDPNGNIRQWWSSTALDNFRGRQNCIVEQYSKYEFYGHGVNPYDTLGENIADNGGLMTSYQAYQRLAAENKEPRLFLPNLRYTPEQIFFIASAQPLCTHYLKETVQYYLNGPHSPASHRVIGSLSNSKGFSSAFKCPSGAPMNPPDKCVIW